MEANPRVVFERLFGAIDSTDPAVRSARLRRQRSIIDSVLDKVRRLHGEVGRRDQRKLDEYVDSVREIERRIQNAEVRGRELPLVDSPAGIPVSYDEHARLMFDMQALAFQTDTTRVITFQIGREQSGATYRRSASPTRTTPFRTTAATRTRSRACSASTRTTRRCSATSWTGWRRPPTARVPCSTTPRSCTAAPSATATGMTFATCRCCRGAGGGGRLAGGRHVRYPAGTQRLTNLQLTLLNTLGVPAEQFGDSTGEQLAELSGVARAAIV